MKSKRRGLEFAIVLIALALTFLVVGRRPPNFLLGSWEVDTHGRHYTVVFETSGQATASAPEMSEPVKVRYEANFASSPVPLDVWAEDEPQPYRMLCELTSGGELRVQETSPDRSRPLRIDERAIVLRRPLPQN
jgi:hypothetical protein